MPWLKIDDGFYDHPKVEDLETSAVGLWLLTAAYSARHLTDGLISAKRARRMGGTEEDIAALVEVGLWEECDEGYRFHDWHAHQPSRDEVEANRAAARERQARRREKLRNTETGRFDEPRRLHAVPSRDGHGESHADVTRDTHRDTPVSHTTPTRPDPARPDPSQDQEPALPLPGTEAPEAKTAKRKPETTLPANWTPTDAHRAKAAEKGLDLAREAETFRLHADTHDRRARNWNAAFTTWLTKAPAPRPQTITNGSPRAGSWMAPRRTA